jgi:hypothetical protein
MTVVTLIGAMTAVTGIVSGIHAMTVTGTMIAIAGVTTTGAPAKQDFDRIARPQFVH